MAVTGMIVAAFVGVAPAIAEPIDSAPSTDYRVLSGEQKQALELSVLEKFVPFAETFWTASGLSEPDTGHYRATGNGVTQPRGAGNVAFVYATLLTAKPQQDTFGGVDRDVMLDHTVQSIRHEALTNRLSGAGYASWGGGTWQASLETYQWAFAAHLLWNHLDEETRELVHTVLTGEADILITKPIATSTPGNTGAEDNGWNTPTPALAAVMFPDDPHRTAWEQASIKLAINASSTDADATSDSMIDGKPLREWIASSNLNDDLTIENHGFFNPIYQQVTHLNIDDAAIFYALAGREVPEAFSFRTEEVWERVLGPITDDNGDIIMPAGQDWISKVFQGLDVLSVLATRFQRADASVLESRALQLVAARQATHPDGSLVGQPDLGYESVQFKRIAASWWNHELFGSSPTPTREQFDASRAQTAGVHRFSSVDVIAARLEGASATMSWNNARPMGLWVPRAEAHLDDPIFTFYAPKSLVGSASGPVGPYSCDCSGKGFSTAGNIGDRDFSMTAFADGTTLLLDRGAGSTFTYALEQISGLVGDRTVYSDSGIGLGDLEGNWVNVANRMGMVVLGGSGIHVADIHATNDRRMITGSKGTGSGNRGAILLPAVGHMQTEALSARAMQPVTPDGWSALLAQAADGSDRMAIARWGGPAEAALQISDPRGAPVTREQASVSGDTSSFEASLDAPGSAGEVIRFFVQANDTLVASQDGDDRAVLVNRGESPVEAEVTYVSPDGVTLTADRVIAPGESVVARIASGELILAGPEYEHLVTARSEGQHLTSSIDGWVGEGRLDESSAGGLTAVIDAVLGHVESALVNATEAEPDTVREAASVAAALRLMSRIRVSGDISGDIADTIDEARTAMTSALERAMDELIVQVNIRPVTTAFPGEPVTVRVSMHNRGHGAASGGTVSFDAPAGWTFPDTSAAFASLAPGGSAVIDVTGTVAGNAAAGPAELSATLAYRARGEAVMSTSTAGVVVSPLLEVAATSGVVPLAVGGRNQADFVVSNNAGYPIEAHMAVSASDGVSASARADDIQLPAGGSVPVTVELANSAVSTGSGAVTLKAVSTAGAAATGSTTVRFSDNLALNPFGSVWPTIFADSQVDAHPMTHANDGDPRTFWVSFGGSLPGGSGPTPEEPISIGVDLGFAVTVGSVTVKPRKNYGPKSYSVQVSEDGQSWTGVGAVVDGPNAAVTTDFEPVTARYIRLVITASYDTRPVSRNVQVAELEVRAP